MPYIIILLLMLGFLLPACATGGSPQQQQQIMSMQAQLDTQGQVMQELARRLELAANSLENNRGPQASLSNEVNSLRQSVAGLTGRMEDAQQKMDQFNSADMPSRLNELNTRVAYLERYLGISIRPAASGSSSPAPGGGQEVVSVPPPPPPSSDPKTIYEAGKRLYEQKSYQAARDRLEELLRNFPNSQYAEAAQFQLGETLYADQKYEEAILAYNQLIKQYGNSKNLLTAQLKQGMSFSALGDKNSAKIIFNKIVSDAPNSDEARRAKELLAQIP
jgi:tol-pal system protein YbgF